MKGSIVVVTGFPAGFSPIGRRGYDHGSIPQKVARAGGEEGGDPLGAREVFFERGFHTATMEEIAQRADISKGAIYFYFQSADDFDLISRR